MESPGRSRGWRNVPHLPLSRALFLSPHVPILGYQSGMCAAYGSYARGNMTRSRQWILSPCNCTMLADLLGCSEVRPAAVPSHYTTRVAGKVFHPTQLQVLNLFYFCTACGKVKASRLEALIGPYECGWMKGPSKSQQHLYF